LYQNNYPKYPPTGEIQIKSKISLSQNSDPNAYLIKSRLFTVYSEEFKLIMTLGEPQNYFN